MMALSVLVIAPEVEGLPRLAQASELTRLGDAPGIDVDPLIGPLVTLERVQARLRSRRYQVVLWSGHGSGGRLLLPNGREAEPRWLASEVHQSGAGLMILAVCDSAQRTGYEGFADVLPANGINLVAMAAEVGDVAAVDYDVALLHSLAAGDNLREAHRIGLEAIKQQADRPQPQLFMADTANLTDQVNRLQAAVAAGHPQEALEIIEQCSATLKRLQEHYQGLDGRVTAIERRLNPPWQVTFWRMCATLVLLFGAALFFFYQSRALLFSPWWMGTTFEVVLVALALLCWRMGDVTMERLQ